MTSRRRARSATRDRGTEALAREFPGGPYFTIVCGSSHRNNDDPIRFPGQPGRSHNHTYVGDRGVDTSTTAASLRAGHTTCDVEEDPLTYWVPTVSSVASRSRPSRGSSTTRSTRPAPSSPHPRD